MQTTCDGQKRVFTGDWYWALNTILCDLPVTAIHHSLFGDKLLFSTFNSWNEHQVAYAISFLY